MALLLLVFSVVPSDGSLAEPFERLPDGRVVFEIFDQKVALPASDHDVKRIHFYPLTAPRSDLNGPLIELGKVLNSPGRARELFEAERGVVSIRITTAWPPHDTGPILGRFDRGSFPLAGPGSPLEIAIRRNPSKSLSLRDGPPEGGSWSPETHTADEDGFYVRIGPTPPMPGSSPQMAYRLPGEQRLWKTDVDLFVVCRWVGVPVRQCRQIQRTSDARISIAWSWYENPIPKAPAPFSENFFPKARWKELDMRLHEVAEYLLLNKPSGELE